MNRCIAVVVFALAGGCAILADPGEVPLGRDAGSIGDTGQTSPEDAGPLESDGGASEPDSGSSADSGSPSDMNGAPDNSTDTSVPPNDGGDAAAGNDYASVVLADQPIGYWRFGDMIAPTAANAIETGADGIYRNGATFGVAGLIEGDDDTAVELDGQDDRVELGPDFAFEGKQPFSLEAWIKPDTIDPEFQALFSNEVSDGGRQGYGLTLNFGRLRFIRNAGSGVYDLITAAQPTTIGETSHVVVTYDGFSILIFHNGTQVASGSGDQQMAANDRTLMIGAGALYNGIDEFDGIIDEVAIYDYPLPPVRVMAHYEAGKPSN